MAVRDINYLKSKFQNGDTPNENDFWDIYDTLFALAPAYSPLVVNITGIILVDENVPPNNLDFEVDISASSTFATLLVSAKTKVAQTGWEYWNGSTMQAMPSDGLHPAYQNRDIGLVTYTWDEASRGVTYYIRYRCGFFDNWGDYRIGKVTV